MRLTQVTCEVASFPGCLGMRLHVKKMGNSSLIHLAQHVQLFLSNPTALSTTGSGILTEADASEYEGEFHDNKRHGEGIQTYALVHLVLETF